MRRRLLIVPLLVLAGVLLARRLRRQRAATAPPAPPAAAPPAPGERFVSVPWTLADAPADEPRLRIRYRGEAHLQLDRVDAQETPTQVFVTVLMRRRPPAEGAPPPAPEREAVVGLSGPLGARELVHAPVDDPADPPVYP